MKWGVVRFPGSLDDADALYALADVMGQQAEMLWHKDPRLHGAQCVVLPGGFSYGDYLRCGAIARFSPIMQSVGKFAADGGLVVGICNGFQILCEAHLLPGVLMRNASLRFVCRDVFLKVERAAPPFTTHYRTGQIVRMPVAHMDGNYFADPATLGALEAEGRVAFRYCAADGAITEADNFNGSARAIAGIFNETRTVLGLMPHPENATDPLLGGTDGQAFFAGLAGALS